MNARVPVAIECSGMDGTRRVEPGFTRIVNTYGCLLVSPIEFEVHELVRLRNVSTQRTADGRIVWKGAQRSDGWDLGVELMGAGVDFWGVEL